MKVTHLNHSDIAGGAARAAYRIHEALRSCGVDSTMQVNQATSGDCTVQGPKTKFEKLLPLIRRELAALACGFLKTQNYNLHSPSIFPSNWPERLNSSNADIVHLHWVAHEMMSISDIGRIKKPTVWTLHDMWAFCGAEHYTDDNRWQDGYHADNRPAYESGFDLNRWTWARKSKHWRQPIHIIANSNWIAQCARNSQLMRDWPVSFIYYPLNIDVWAPIDKGFARSLWGFPTDVPLLLFGAIGGGKDLRKGFDLLVTALGHLRGEMPELHLIVFGQLAPPDPPDFGFPLHFVGRLHDDASLRVLYNAADVMVVPSRLEAFGQTAAEAQACGTPVVAFNTGGLPDIVDHQHTGYLAEAFDTVDLANGIRWVVQEGSTGKLRESARNKAVERFAYPVVAKEYLKIYEKIKSN